jgi:hypothetical protein
MFQYVLVMLFHCYTNLTPGEHIITNCLKFFCYSAGTELLMISLSVVYMWAVVTSTVFQTSPKVIVIRCNKICKWAGHKCIYYYLVTRNVTWGSHLIMKCMGDCSISCWKKLFSCHSSLGVKKNGAIMCIHCSFLNSLFLKIRYVRLFWL